MFPTTTKKFTNAEHEFQVHLNPRKEKERRKIEKYVKVCGMKSKSEFVDETNTKTKKREIQRRKIEKYKDEK